MTKPTALLAAVLIAGTAGTALADASGKDWMPIDQAIRKLGEAGYDDIRKIGAEDGRWEGKASKDGRVVKFTVDPKSGAVAEVAKGERKEERKSEENKDGKKAD